MPGRSSVFCGRYFLAWVLPFNLPRCPDLNPPLPSLVQTPFMGLFVFNLAALWVVQSRASSASHPFFQRPERCACPLFSAFFESVLFLRSVYSSARFKYLALSFFVELNVFPFLPTRFLSRAGAGIVLPPRPMVRYQSRVPSRSCRKRPTPPFCAGNGDPLTS